MGVRGPVEREVKAIEDELDKIDSAAKAALAGPVDYYVARIRNQTQDLRRKLQSLARKVRVLEISAPDE
jgi:ABC-type Zn uptake system ZnuABC Zn-binding protein ZnuA